MYNLEAGSELSTPTEGKTHERTDAVRNGQSLFACFSHPVILLKERKLLQSPSAVMLARFIFNQGASELRSIRKKGQLVLTGESEKIVATPDLRSYPTSCTGNNRRAAVRD